MRLLFLRPGAELDDGRSGISECQQNMLSVGSRDRHLGLRSEDQMIAELSCSSTFRRTGRQEGQCSQPEPESRRVPSADFSKLGNFTLAVQQKEIARGPRCHSPARGWHADSREAGNEHGSRTAPEHPLSRERGDYRPRAGQQDQVRTLAPDPADDRSMREHLDFSFAGRPNLRCGRHDRVLDQQLCGLPGAGQRVQCRCAPLQI
jgi:hypothetical protein